MAANLAHNAQSMGKCKKLVAIISLKQDDGIPSITLKSKDWVIPKFSAIE